MVNLLSLFKSYDQDPVLCRVAIDPNQSGASPPINRSFVLSISLYVHSCEYAIDTNRRKLAIRIHFFLRRGPDLFYLLVKWMQILMTKEGVITDNSGGTWLSRIAKWDIGDSPPMKLNIDHDFGNLWHGIWWIFMFNSLPAILECLKGFLTKFPKFWYHSLIL